MRKRTEVYTISGFINGEPPVRVEGGIPDPVKSVVVSSITIGIVTGAKVMVFAHTGAVQVVAASAIHPVSQVFDAKIWPLFLDIGEPLAKTMMAIGIYQCIRSNVDKGWKMVYRSGVGLVGLYLIDGAIHILQGIGASLQAA